MTSLALTLKDELKAARQHEMAAYPAHGRPERPTQGLRQGVERNPAPARPQHATPGALAAGGGGNGRVRAKGRNGGEEQGGVTKRSR